MNKKAIAIELSKLKRFEKPKEHLEQYESDSEIVAEVLWHLQLSERLPENIADYGAGTGILGIGCLLLGKKVTFIEKDPEAIQVLKENLEDYEDYEIIEADVLANNKDYDMIIMNPPFGTRNKGADKVFLEKHGFDILFQWDTDFPIKASYSHHKSKVSRKKVSILYSEKK